MAAAAAAAMCNTSLSRESRPLHTFQTLSRSVAALAVVALVGAGCGAESDTPATDATADCDRLAQETAEVMVAVAHHAIDRAPDVPSEVLDPADPTEQNVWEAAARLAETDPDLQRRVEQLDAARQQAGCTPGWAQQAVQRRFREEMAGLSTPDEQGQVDVDQRAALNVLALLLANLGPTPATYDVPEGIPPQFPVHPDAELTGHSRDGDTTTATWRITGPDRQQVEDYYSDQLQQATFGGWDIVGRFSATQRPREAPIPRNAPARYVLTGYGMRGELVIATEDHDDTVTTVTTVTLTLHPET